MMRASSLAGRHILVVEDDYFVAGAVARALVARGAIVLGPAPSVDRALCAIADAEVIEAALLDINLAGEMVYPVAEELSLRGVPFAFATGYDRLAIDPRFAGVPRFEKPIDLDGMARALFEDALLPAR
jgi:ActR/RegA family two-component response regulator